MPLRLPLIEKIEAQLRKPTIDAMRARLGGREPSPPDAGSIVSWVSPDGQSRVGVVLGGSAEERFMWTSDGVVRRAERTQVREVGSYLPEDLVMAAEEIKAFASLSEGDSVLVDESSASVEMLLIEKCRFGALVAREDGSVLGVGYRKVRPLARVERCDQTG
ncbi:MAG: hypothetical protein U0165_07155 [Polyangiaceae bacterium]